MALGKALKGSTIKDSEKNLSDRLWTKTKTTIKNEGVRSFLLKAGRQLRKTCFDTNAATWFVRDLKQPISSEQNSDVRFELADKGDFEHWLDANSTQFPWIYVEQEVLATVNDRKFAFVCKSENEIVAFLKVAVENAYVLDYDEHLPLPRDVAFIQDTFVLPQFRRKGIARFLISQAMMFLHDRGYKRVFCHIPRWNVASTRTYQGLGFRKISHVRFIRLFKLKFYTKDPRHLIGSIACA